MIWFNIKELEYRISNDELSDRDGFNYLLAFFILSAIGYGMVSGNENGWIKFFSCVAAILINVWGLRAIYEANKSVDGKDFFKRFFAFYWVIGFRLFLFTIPIWIIIGIIMGITSAISGSNQMEMNPIKDLFIMIVASLYSLICYLMIINSIQRIQPKTE